MKNIVFAVLLLLPLQTHTADLDKLLRNFNISSIDASIVQVIAETGREPQRYEGRYRAYKESMRIDYTKPFPQIVIVNKGKLLWYFPETKELWTMEQGNVPTAHPFYQLEALKERISIKSKDRVFYGFFNAGYRYTLFDSVSKTTIELTIDREKGYPVKKTVYTARSIEIMRELYSGYAYIQNVWFPTIVEVTARTQSGTTRNVTRYDNVILNSKIPPDVFTLKLPKGVRTKRM